MQPHASPIHRRVPIPLWLTALAASTLVACGGGSSPSTTNTPSSQVATFIDAKVEGLAYRSSSRRGMTDRNGNLAYKPGEKLTFSVGSMVLGSLTPKGNKITPMDLVPSATDASDPRVTRILRTLQSLDADGDLNNGIQIAPEAHDFANNRSSIRLDDDATTDTDVEDRLYTGQYTRSRDEALAHFRDHKDDDSNEHLGYDDSGNTSGSPTTTTQPANTTGRLLASNCFQCHGTLGRGGFDSIRGSEASEVLDFLTKPASSNIMAAHAQGYTRAQLESIITYLKQ